MDNPSFKSDESLPRQNVKLQNTNNDDTVFSGIFAWREIIQGFVSKHPKSVNVGTVLTIGAVFHAYFFYCLYRYAMLHKKAVWRCPKTLVQSPSIADEGAYVWKSRI